MSPISILDYHQPSEFKIGDTIVRSWNIYSRHFLTFILMVGIVEVPPLLLRLYAGSSSPGVTIGVGLLNMVLSSFAQAVVIFAAFQDLRGMPVNAVESLKIGLRRTFPVIFASIAVGFAVGVGMLLCLAPGLIALAALPVALPACVMEQLGPIESIRRSADLTSGHRWPILGVGVAWLIIAFVAGLLIVVAMPTPSSPRQLSEWAIGVLSSSFTAVYAAILYHDLRAVREGIGIHEIASVFD